MEREHVASYSNVLAAACEDAAARDESAGRDGEMSKWESEQ